MNKKRGLIALLVICIVFMLLWMCSGYRADENPEHKSREHRHRTDRWETERLPTRSRREGGESL